MLTQEVGTPIKQTMRSRVTNVRDMFDVHVAMAETYPWVELREGLRSLVEIRQEPVGVVGRDRALERPVLAHGREARPGAAGRLHGRAQARRGDAAQRLRAGGDPRRGRAARGRAERRPGRPRRSARRSCAIPGVDKISFTGSTVAGKAIAVDLRRAAQALQPRARRQVGGDHPRRRRPRRRRWRACSPPRSTTTARCASTRPASSRRAAATTRSSRRSPRATGRSTIGDPMDPATDVGPLIHGRPPRPRRGLHPSGRDEGARVTIGGGRRRGLDRGFYVEPTIFADVDNGMRIAQEEIFGPVLVDHPVRRRGRRRGGSPTTRSTGSPARSGARTPSTPPSIARRVRTGNIGVNLFMLDFAAPFGGFKQSGIGREYGPEGIAPSRRSRRSTAPSRRRPPRRRGRRLSVRPGAGRAAAGSSARARRRCPRAPARRP